MRGSIIFLFLVHLTLALYSQGERKLIRKGNEFFYKNDNKKAEEHYRQALEKNNKSFEAAFNLGDALYKQENYDEAIKQFESITNKSTDKTDIAKVYHNLGNSFLKKKEFEKSIEAYKNSLKNNPADEDTRYNLAYAQKMLQQQQKQNEQNKDDKKKDDKNKDQENKDKQDQKDKNDKKDKKDQQQKDQQDEKRDQQQKQSQPQDKMSKEEAKRLLDALNQQEKNIQDKIKKQKRKAVQVEVEKDW